MKNKPQIRLTVKTEKLSFTEDTDDMCYDRLCKKLKKLYNADEVYLDNGKIIVVREEIVGTWKSKRIDGAKI
jgi:hypothetical protein